jgi:hypothetical protein
MLENNQRSMLAKSVYDKTGLINDAIDTVMGHGLIEDQDEAMY